MRWAAVVAVIAACGNKGADPGPASGSAKPAATTTDAVIAIDAAPPPLSAKVTAARCDEACLFLTDTPLAKLDDAFKAACPGKPTPQLGFEDCKELDYYRNCIFAAHGVTYRKKKWKAMFGTKPWYAPDPAVSAATVLGELERANVHELSQRGKACKKNLNISGADFERVKAWFGAWPKQPPLPSVTFSSDEPVDAKGFVAAVHNELGGGKISLAKATAIYLGDDLHYTGADYPSDDMPSAMVTAIKAADEKKLRGIRVAIPKVDDPKADSSGTHVFLIYDDKDQLRGLEIRPYIYEACVIEGSCGD